jgi:soluble lytic murein transglycosylase-like protein
MHLNTGCGCDEVGSKMSYRIIFPGVFLCFLLCFSSLSFADVYRFRDERGVWHFSNVKNDPRFRLYMRTPNYSKPANQYIRDYDEAITKASKKFRVESSLIKAVIKAESDFDQKAVSHKGAQGLMQLMPDTAYAMEVTNPFDPEDNILGGTRYLSLMLDRFQNNVQLALAAYNAGPEKVEEHRGIPPFPETRTFVERVLTYYGQYGAPER